jgi:PIN domain nuclease of toxin-antitoxin system
LRLLVDTHVLLWAITEPRRIPLAVGHAMGSPENETFISVICFWEIAIKKRTGKLSAPDDLLEQVERHPDFRMLPITAAHAWRVKTLPLHHRDPFDHLLVAQALIEHMTVVTHDRAISQYGVPILAV